ncbi:MAG: hypothetical protein NTV57_01990 [Cyanobacteria bacterium]|nr:hypothetical protein [Cyanobacteriota bacterium]
MHANLYDRHASDAEAITAQARTWLSTCSGSGQRSSDGVNDRTGMTQGVLALEPPESTDG